MSVYIISHKQTAYPSLDGYNLIQVGAYNKEHYCEINDAENDNISQKNPFFCELTGLYWIWKNIKKDDYIGIVHYRRFFTDSFFEDHFLTEKKIKKILKRYDVILPIKTKLKSQTVREQFLENTGTEYDLQILESVIKDTYPDYYDSYCKVFDGYVCYFRNMFITSKSIYDNYCQWLFNILFEVEKRIDITNYDDYHKRIYGFLAERLLTVYILNNCFKVYEVGVVQTDLKQNFIKRFAKSVQRVFYSLIQK